MANQEDGSTVEYPAYTLVVAHPFADYERGAAITDPALVAEVMAGENSRHVRKVNA